MGVKYIIIILFFLFILLGALEMLNLMDNKNNPATIGSNDAGYVIKDTYASNGHHSKKIAIITGIHPREKIAIDPMKTTIRNYALTHDIEITNYDIHVLDNPENYTVGRNNGEELAAKYIVPNIKKSDYRLVIIFHAHQNGYGDGFYIATPLMDNKSIEMAQNITKSLPSFKYYKSSQSGYKSTSALRVSNPIAEEGYPTFIYEIPEQTDIENATDMTNKLLDASLNKI